MYGIDLHAGICRLTLYGWAIRCQVPKHLSYRINRHYVLNSDDDSDDDDDDDGCRDVEYYEERYRRWIIESVKDEEIQRTMLDALAITRPPSRKNQCTTHCARCNC
jgi:hypothetical protein